MVIQRMMSTSWHWNSATKTLLNHSRGTEDFTKFVNRLILKTDIVGTEWSQERNYLLKIGLNKDDYFIYLDRKY